MKINTGGRSEILTWLVLNRSLGCGIGYGYLHRIPSRPAQPNLQSKNVLQSTVTDHPEELVASDHTEVRPATSLRHFICPSLFHSMSEPLSLCPQVPSEAESNPSSVSKIDVNQIEGAARDLCASSPTQPAVDSGNKM